MLSTMTIFKDKTTNILKKDMAPINIKLVSKFIIFFKLYYVYV